MVGLHLVRRGEMSGSLLSARLQCPRVVRGWPYGTGGLMWQELTASPILLPRRRGGPATPEHRSRGLRLRTPREADARVAARVRRRARPDLARHTGEATAWTCMALATKGDVMARTSAL
jgi:hypothetical protein